MDCTNSSKNMNNLPWLLTAYQGHRHTRRGYKWLWLHTSFTAIWIDLTTGFATEDSGRDQKANCEWTRAFWSPSLNFVPICLVSMDDFPVPYGYMLMLQDWLLTVEKKTGGSSSHDCVMGKRAIRFVLPTQTENVSLVYGSAFGDPGCESIWEEKCLYFIIWKAFGGSFSKVNWGWRFRTHKKESEPFTMPTKFLERSPWAIKC